MNSPLTASLVQCDAVLGDVGRNLEAHLEQITIAHDQGAGLAVFPELSLTGYTLRDLTSEIAMAAMRATRVERRWFVVLIGLLLGQEGHPRGARGSCRWRLGDAAGSRYGLPDPARIMHGRLSSCKGERRAAGGIPPTCRRRPRDPRPRVQTGFWTVGKGRAMLGAAGQGVVRERHATGQGDHIQLLGAR